MLDGLVTVLSPPVWPFPTPVIPGSITATGRSYRANNNSQVTIDARDLSSLLNLGFTIGGPNQSQSVFVELSSAQILTLFSVPILMVPAQGPNTVIIPDTLMLTASAGDVYTLGNNIFLYYGDNFVDFNMPSTNPLTSNAGQSFQYSKLITNNFGQDTITATANLPLNFLADVSDPTGGNKSANLALTYSVYNIATPA